LAEPCYNTYIDSNKQEQEMNKLIQEMAFVAAQRTGTNLMAIDPKFVQALAELVAVRCADIADEADTCREYNAGGEICEAFGLTAE
jgi:hypothetical protein